MRKVYEKVPHTTQQQQQHKDGEMHTSGSRGWARGPSAKLTMTRDDTLRPTYGSSHPLLLESFRQMETFQVVVTINMTSCP